jgi:hypothetical protein
MPGLEAAKKLGFTLNIYEDEIPPTITALDGKTKDELLNALEDRVNLGNVFV